MSVCRTVAEIFSVKIGRRNFETGGKGCARSLKMAPFDRSYCRSGEEQSHKSPPPGGAVVLMSTVGLSSLFSFILRTHLAYDVSTNLELAS